jgi:hypothetical protein
MSTYALEKKRIRLTRGFEEADTGTILREAGFIDDTRHPDCLNWFGAWKNQELQITAGPWIAGWRCRATSASRRTLMDEEFELPERYKRGVILNRLYWIWCRTFPNALVPDAFLGGEDYEDYLSQKNRLNPGLPHLQASSKILRFMINHIRDLVDIAGPNLRLLLRHKSDQLILRAGPELHIPALGTWIGTVEVQLGDFLNAVPPRFPRSCASLDYTDGRLLLEGRTIPAQWSEE